ncbi:SAF domain-containing protein [Paenibacillus sp. F411]|uniref:SAF domain-containing protein n=1 Tax=Paenibacillus sp. F411 TaxID=2820239 RepID=UPI001AAF9576|nr:SAF domain-containing protein [Paenibacillus sp. F411]MBO2943030.1 SAF domain-containing protein [Paenibacillus sp. F411]
MPILTARNRRLLLAGLTGAGVTAFFAAGGLYFAQDHFQSQYREEKQQYLDQIEELQVLASAGGQGMKTLWVPDQDVPAGELLSMKKMKQVQVPAEMLPENVPASLEELQGKGAKIELRKGTPITLSMLFDQEMTPDDLRHRELKSVWLPSNLKLQDQIDIRIQFPTGQDFIVLAKKKVDRLAAPAFWTTLNEEEILLLSSAMVDAYLNGASLYALTYVEPGIQDRAIPNYPPNVKVNSLIRSDPNIIRAAERALEVSIRQALEKDLAPLNTGDSPNSYGSSFGSSSSIRHDGGSSGTQDFATWIPAGGPSQPDLGTGTLPSNEFMQERADQETESSRILGAPHEGQASGSTEKEADLIFSAP